VIRWADVPDAVRLRPRLPDELDGIASATAVRVPGTDARLAEHPAWSESAGGLIWVDIDAGVVHRTTPDGETTTVFSSVGAVGAALPSPDGGLVVLAAEGALAVPADGARPAVLGGPPETGFRFNDAALDPSGRVWAGVLPIEDPPPGGSPQGELWRLDDSGQWEVVLVGLGCPNGIAWSADGRTLVFCESDTRRLAVADYEPASGEASNWRIEWEFDGSGDWVPDGLELRPDGRLWVAFWGLSRVVRFGVDGRPELWVATADAHTTSMTVDPHGNLWVTSAGGLWLARDLD